MRTVLHVVPDLRRQAGGIAAMVSALANALHTQGIESNFLTMAHDVDFLRCSKTTSADPSDTWCPIRLERLATKTLLDLPDGTVVHSHGLWSMLNHAALRAATRAGLPCIISPHGMLLPWARNHKRLRKDMAWALYQRRDLLCADRLHVTSADEARIVSSINGPSMVAEIPFGVDLPAEMPPMPRENKTLLFLGRLHPVKNLETLVRAFVEAEPQGWSLRLAGPDEGGYRATLEALVAELGTARVTFAGPVYGTNKAHELAGAQAVVLPSFTENFGAVVAEALAIGRPVIASQGTPWQVLDEERCGWWVAPDHESLRRAVTELAKTPSSILTEMGARGRNLVARAYSWERIATDMAKLYDGLPVKLHSTRL